MSVAWLYPAGFAALAALLLPLLVHLARRDQQAPLDFAALRWLRAAPRPHRRLRVDERLLLALRLLLLATLAAWLAQPVLRGAEDRRPYVAVMPGVDAAALRQQALAADARRHWLAAGFPALEDPAPAGRQPTSSLLRELDAQLPAGVRVVVVATPDFGGTDAQRPRLSRRLEWRVVQASRALARSGAAGTSSSDPAPRLVLQGGDAGAPGARYLRAVQQAWPRHPDAPSVRVRLQDGPLPPELHRVVADGGTALLGAGVVLPTDLVLTPVWRDDAGLPLLEAGTLGRGRLLRFARPLQAQAMPQLLEADFPHRLREALHADAVAPARVDARAYAPRTDGRALPPPPRPLQSWLALVVALLFALERLVATRASRWTPA